MPFNLKGEYISEGGFSQLVYLQSQIEKGFRNLESSFSTTEFENVKYNIEMIYNPDLRESYLERLKEFGE